jgi:hypothetical protein
MAKDRFTIKERHGLHNAILHLHNEKTFVLAEKENNTISYTEKIKSYEKSTGNQSDEELIIALILLQIIKNYDYDPAKIEIKSSFEIGERREEGARAVEADICIKNDKGYIEIICKVKRIQDYFGTDDQTIIKQLIKKINNSNYN